MELLGLTIFILLECASYISAQSDLKTSPPAIVKQGVQRQPYRSEDSVELPCKAEGVPPPKYTWYRDDEVLEIGNDLRMTMITGEGTLIISKPEAKDQGFYQCNATNSFGTSLTIKTLLQLANLDRFPSRKPLETHTPEQGSSLKLSCVPPNSFPKARIFWSVVKSGQPFQPVREDARVSKDFDGNLWFGYVDKNDARDGAHYVCMVENPYLKTLVRGEDAVIRPSGTTISSSAVQVLWTSVTNALGLRGENLRLKCIFSGKPTPNVKWERRNGKMPTHRFEGANTELIIPNLQFEDTGYYECIGRNQETLTDGVRKSFSVTVQAKPFWIEEPQDVSAAEEENAVFRCKAGGDPSPFIHWFINGVRITDPNLPKNERRIQRGVHEIRFVNLTAADAQVIQCNASNAHGWVFADVYLNVMSEPPSFIISPKNDKISAGLASYNMTCRIRGAPKPLVWWVKDDTMISGGDKYIIHLMGTLEIMRVQSTDAGKYSCNARNKFGEESSSAELVVREPTRILMSPKSMTVTAGSQAKFICTATTDPDEMGNLKIDWKKDGDFIDYVAAQRVFKNRRDNAVTISGCIPLDTGRYTCVATNGLNTVEATANLLVLAKPEPPTDVSVTRCQGRSAEIKWSPGSDNNSPILGYTVDYNTTFAPSVWYKHDKVIEKSHTETTVQVSPGATFTFRVRARNVIGISEPSAHSKGRCITQPAAPDNNPDNVRTIDKSPTKLWIQWTPMPEIDHNANDFSYSIIYQRLDDGSAPRPPHKVTRFQNRLDYWLDLDVGVTYKPYKLLVQAVNSNGFGPPPTPVIGFSGEGEPNIAPTGFKLDESYAISSTEARFTWDVVDPKAATINGWMTGYAIEYARIINGQTARRRRLKVPLAGRKPEDEYAKWKGSQASRGKRQISTMSAIVSNLPPYSHVTAYVRVTNKRYAGPPSNSITINTPEGTPGAIVNLVVVAVGSNHIDLKWDRPDEPNGIIVGYNVYFQEVIKTKDGRNTLGGKQPRLPQITLEPNTNPASYKSRLAGLQDRTKYRIYIHARTRIGEGIENFIEATTRMPEKPGRPDFRITDVGLTTMNVTWLPDQRRPGGGFFVKYRKEGRNYWEHTSVQSNQKWINITNLEPGVVYELQVVSYNGEKHQTGSGTKVAEMLGASAVTSSVASAGWFIGLLVALILLVAALVIVCYVKRKRAGQYPVQEKEALRGGYYEPEPEEHGFPEYNRGADPALNRSRGSMDSVTKPVESDTDSMDEYGETDPGQYGAKKHDDRGHEGTDPASPAAFSTIV